MNKLTQNSIFQSKRLCIRYLVNSDFAAFHEMQSDPDVMLYTSGKAQSEKENRQDLSECIDKYNQPGNRFWIWAVTLKDTKAFIGTCALVPHDHGLEIGYRLLKRCFGKGYGQEMCDALIDYAKNEYPQKQIFACVDTRNLASVKILDRSCLTYTHNEQNDLGFTDRVYTLK